MTNQYAVFRQPDRVLVGIEPAGFNVIKLAEQYGAGDYQVVLFKDGQPPRRTYQTVHPRLGPPKKTKALPLSMLPGDVSES